MKTWRLETSLPHTFPSAAHMENKEVFKSYLKPRASPPSLRPLSCSTLTHARAYVLPLASNIPPRTASTHSHRLGTRHEINTVCTPYSGRLHRCHEERKAHQTTEAYISTCKENPKAAMNISIDSLLTPGAVKTEQLHMVAAWSHGYQNDNIIL